MKISLVSISFNQVDYLRYCIDSVVSQNYGDLEYILVDPGSIDGSRELIDEYQNLLTKKIFSADKGPADGLNKGFALATGEIFGFLNSDDILMPGSLEQIAGFFERNPEIDVVSGHSFIINGEGRILRRCFSETFSLPMFAHNSCILMQPSTFFRSRAFRLSPGFNVLNRTNWDGEFFAELALAGARFALIDSFLSGYRLHPSSITSSMKLHSGMKDYQKKLFRKIMGRDRKLYDVPVGVFLRLYKHVRSPRGLLERIIKGPIYGRS
ncbi:glycosyltransferase family 2 protein [Polynucleobacter sp. es-MAR-4]|uniref:glycosyltransferase family 2 protein n=1 Tax=Polynucleobacter sp. es-MAR-4 TaxID=1855655 RepID=UPI001C0D3188|nr:glycosyltransferase family 2 protein [Polynucleobacter sp. es-MAR-4]MBU3637565.1 glycosyltransferase [Polynucleobacter sp. es-MAR-4]